MSQRMEKVQKLARRVLSEEIRNLKDPRIGFATVTGVRMSADLRHARVFVSVMGSEDDQQKTIAALQKAAPHLRHELGRQVRIKYSPELKFELDHTPEHAQHMEDLFRRLHTEQEPADDA